MTRAGIYPKHERDSCSDERPTNADASGTVCKRCTALALDSRDELLQALIGEHDALDLLLAERCIMDKNFRPTKWSKWSALVAGARAITNAKRGLE